MTKNIGINNPIELITVLGPTASGKTTFATQLAYYLDTEIISGDSRQVYRKMDIGTGKDLNEYIVNGKNIPYHLIDIADPGYKYNVFEYQHDFWQAFTQIKNKNKIPVLCGGTGLYIESVLKGYKLFPVPENPNLRKSLEKKTLTELTKILNGYKALHNTTDVDTVKRAIRAIEIEEYYLINKKEVQEFPSINSLIIGIDIEREERRKKISKRLKSRLDEGMIEEVKSMLDDGVLPEDLLYYGLEYKYVTNYILGNITYQEMFNQLEIAIHQFAKRQMTWFRGMERKGFNIHWLNASLPFEEKLEILKKDKKTSFFF
jgi:tRNA dimethylallyltransferase